MSAEPPSAGDPSPATDEEWRWDGERWERDTDRPAAPGGDGETATSPDGHWVWDGRQWQPVPG